MTTVKRLTDGLPKHKTPLSNTFYTAQYNKLRRAKAILFDNILSRCSKYMELSIKERNHLLTMLERACYNTCIDKAIAQNVVASWRNDIFSCMYGDYCYKISSNLEQNGLVRGSNLALNILLGNINIAELPNLESQQILPKKYKKIMAKIRASENVKETVKYSEMYRCGKCHKNRCTIKSVINRSLDEDIGLRITCLNCGYEFGA